MDLSSRVRAGDVTVQGDVQLDRPIIVFKETRGQKVSASGIGSGARISLDTGFRRYDGFDLGMTVLIWDGYLKPEQLQA